MRDDSLLILEPPYANARRLHDVAPELGAIALFDAVDGRPTTNEVRAQMERAPWCPLCILAGEDSGMRATRRLPRTCVVFEGEAVAASAGDFGGPILRAVAARPRPTPSDLVEWLTRRTRVPMIGRLLSELFTRPTMRRNEAATLPYSTREQYRLLGEWSAYEWQRAAILADIAADRTLLNRIVSSDDESAAEQRRSIQELLGVSEREFHQRYGWEWVLEAALRRSGFFEKRHAASRAFQLPRAVVPPLVATGVALGGAGFEPRRATA